MYYVRNYNDNNLTKFPLHTILSEAEKLLKDPFNEKSEVQRYPLTNIGYAGKKLVFTIALAGFKPENIKLTYVGNVIKVVATIEDSHKSLDSRNCKCSCCNPNITWVQQNISFKDAERIFRLPDTYMDCDISSKYVNGLLTIVVTPKEEDPSQIEISTEDTDLLEKCDCKCKCNSEEPEQENSEPETPVQEPEEEPEPEFQP